MLTLHGTMTNLLKTYSDFVQKEVVFPQNGSHKEKFDYAQEFWIRAFEDKSCKTTLFKHFYLGKIDGSVGSSGFLMPESVEQRIKAAFNPADVVEYSSCTVDKDLEILFNQYCQEESIIHPETILEPENIAMGYGTHYLLQLAIKTLCKNPDDVIAIPKPTYGLFLDPIEEAGGSFWEIPSNAQTKNSKKNNPKMIDHFREKNSQLKEMFFEELQIRFELIEKIIPKTLLLGLRKLKHALTQKDKDYAYYDHLVKQINEIITSREIYKNASKKMQALYQLPFCPRIRAYLNINPHTPTGVVQNQIKINQIADELKAFDDLHVIDDLTHQGIYLDEIKAGTFAKSSMSVRTITLISFSKTFAVAGFRAGIAFSTKEIASNMNRLFFHELTMPAWCVPTTMKAIFATPKIERDEYLNENNQEYKFRLALIHAMTYKLEAVKDKTLRDSIKKYLDSLPNIKPEDRQSLLEGIPDLNVNKPEGSFFVLLDFSAFKGKYLGNIQLDTSLHFRNAFFHLADLNTISGEMNFEFDAPQVRFSLSLSREEIVESLLRIKGIMSLIRDYPLSDQKPVLFSKVSHAPILEEKRSSKKSTRRGSL